MPINENIIVEFSNVSKKFGNIVANSDITMQIVKGTIHGIVGENGAGKSTAMKLLYGLYKHDEGIISVNQKICKWHSPSEAIKNGIGMVHQHFMLAKPYTALDNILLGNEYSKSNLNFLPKFLKIIDRKNANQYLTSIMEKSGLNVNLNENIENLSVGLQQRVEILKLLYANASLLILDEPTAVLTPQEVSEFFSILKKLKAEGKTIIIITHKLKEVMEITDKVTVFHKGKVTGTLNTNETHEEELAQLMVGRKVVLQTEALTEQTLGKTVVELNNIEIRKKNEKKSILHKLSLNVKEGEIVGIAGVEGNGQSDLLQLLYTPDKYYKERTKYKSTGSYNLFGVDVSKYSARQIRELGTGIIPEDRQKEAVMMTSSLLENFLLGFQDSNKYISYGFIKWGKLKDETINAIAEHDVRPPLWQNSMKSLSGGNQQKFVFARELSAKPKFFIIAHPTRGVDVGAIEAIHKKIREERSKGSAILLVSSELDEIINLSDRIIVLYEGEIVAEFTRKQGDKLMLNGIDDKMRIGYYMGGGK